MTGNIVDLNNPGNANGNINSYPNCQWSTDALDIEPSIRGRQLYIPLDAFFCESSNTNSGPSATLRGKFFEGSDLR